MADLGHEMPGYRFTHNSLEVLGTPTAEQTRAAIEFITLVERMKRGARPRRRRKDRRKGAAKCPSV